jgi:mannose-6-phosphate isomerase-like protein (cupin superfamily)
MADYEVLEIGAPGQWRSHTGGFRPETTRQGRRVVDHDLAMQFIGLTANAMSPGEDAGYWHSHSRIEELYVVLDGEGEMGLDDDVVPLHPGTVVRVGPGVWRTWRCAPDASDDLRWLCIRAGGETLPRLPDDSSRDDTRPMPW